MSAKAQSTTSKQQKNFTIIEQSEDVKEIERKPRNSQVKSSLPPYASTAVSVPDIKIEAILEFQNIAPAPSQTYYQIALYPFHPSGLSQRERSSRSSLKRGCIVLREWPRKRYFYLTLTLTL